MMKQIKEISLSIKHCCSKEIFFNVACVRVPVCRKRNLVNRIMYCYYREIIINFEVKFGEWKTTFTFRLNRHWHTISQYIRKHNNNNNIQNPYSHLLLLYSSLVHTHTCITTNNLKSNKKGVRPHIHRKNMIQDGKRYFKKFVVVLLAQIKYNIGFD